MSTLSFKTDDLGGMKFSDLSKLAQKEGVDQRKIDDAMDDDVPKKTLISLLTKIAEEKRQESFPPETIKTESIDSYKLSDAEKVFLEKLVEIYPDLPSVDEISSNKSLMKIFSKSNDEKNIPLSIEERQGKFDETKCHARVWKAKPGTGGLGYDSIQCSSKHKNGCLCNKHNKQFIEGNLWLGKITEPRPEEPVGPPNSKEPRIHVWCTDTDGNEIIKERKTKVKVSSGKTKENMKKEFLRNLTKGELLSLLKEKDEIETVQNNEKPNNSSSDEEDDIYETITVEGVEYQHQKEDNTVIRISDFVPVGKWNKEEGRIIFHKSE